MILQEAVILRKTSIKNFYFFSHLMPLVSFYTLWQYKKCSGFVTFPGDIDRQIPVVWNGLIPANLNPLSDNPTKWSNTLKQFVGNLPTNCLSVFDNFMKLAVKGLKHFLFHVFINIAKQFRQSCPAVFPTYSVFF